MKRKSLRRCGKKKIFQNADGFLMYVLGPGQFLAWKCTFFIRKICFSISRRKSKHNHKEIKSKTHFWTRDVPNVTNSANRKLPRPLYPRLGTSYSKNLRLLTIIVFPKSMTFVEINNFLFRSPMILVEIDD